MGDSNRTDGGNDENSNPRGPKQTATEQALAPLAELPLTPTFLGAELASGSLYFNDSSTNLGPHSPNVDFDTAAYMLMAGHNDLLLLTSPKHGPNPTYAPTSLLPPLPAADTPQQPSTPTSTFDFDSIGQLLMSPGTGSLLASSLNTTAPPNVLDHSMDAFPQSPRFGLPCLKQTPVTTSESPVAALSAEKPLAKGPPRSAVSSPNTRLFTNLSTAGWSPLPPYNPLESPLNSLAMMNHVGNMRPVPDFEQTPLVPPPMLSLNPLDATRLRYNTELLSNTESLALESFLDSIANEGIAADSQANQKKRKFVAIKKKETNRADGDTQRYHGGAHDPPSNMYGHTTKSGNGATAIGDDCHKEKPKQPPANLQLGASTKPGRSSGPLKKTPEDSMKKSALKQERRRVHNITEQKRRDMIKQAFEKLHAMIVSSKFDLEDKESFEQRSRKRRRKTPTDPSKAKRPMKKYEVLKRSVREIQFLVKENSDLYKLLGEKEIPEKEYETEFSVE